MAGRTFPTLSEPSDFPMLVWPLQDARCNAGKTVVRVVNSYQQMFMNMLAEYAMLGWVPATTAGPNRVKLNTPGLVSCLGEPSNGDARSGKGKGPALVLSLIPDSTRQER